jgi:hypothetical protein
MEAMMNKAVLAAFVFVVMTIYIIDNKPLDESILLGAISMIMTISFCLIGMFFFHTSKLIYNVIKNIFKKD